jgi:hypothetical protein
MAQTELKMKKTQQLGKTKNLDKVEKISNNRAILLPAFRDSFCHNINVSNPDARYKRHCQTHR